MVVCDICSPVLKLFRFCHKIIKPSDITLRRQRYFPSKKCGCEEENHKQEKAQFLDLPQVKTDSEVEFEKEFHYDKTESISLSPISTPQDLHAIDHHSCPFSRNSASPEESPFLKARPIYQNIDKPECIHEVKSEIIIIKSPSSETINSICCSGPIPRKKRSPRKQSPQRSVNLTSAESQTTENFNKIKLKVKTECKATQKDDSTEEREKEPERHKNANQNKKRKKSRRESFQIVPKRADEVEMLNAPNVGTNSYKAKILENKKKPKEHSAKPKNKEYLINLCLTSNFNANGIRYKTGNYSKRLQDCKIPKFKMKPNDYNFLPYKYAPFVLYQICMVIDILMPYLAFLAMKEAFFKRDIDRFKILTSVSNFLFYARRTLIKTVAFYIANGKEEIIKTKMNSIWFCLEKAKTRIRNLNNLRESKFFDSVRDSRLKLIRGTMEEKESMLLFLTKACSIQSLLPLNDLRKSISVTDIEKPSIIVLRMFNVDTKLLSIRPKSQ